MDGTEVSARTTRHGSAGSDSQLANVNAPLDLLVLRTNSSTTLPAASTSRAGGGVSGAITKTMLATRRRAMAH